MRHLRTAVVALVFLGLPVLPSAQSGSSWEDRFRSIPQSANVRAYVQRMSARPHHVGSAYGKDNAEWILARFREWGWDASIEQFDVLFPTPKERVLEMVEPTRFVAKLEEPAVAVDPTSGQKAEQLPTYNAYSVDGDVTAPLVYVNYGRPEDYDHLERLGVSVRGAIAIARYGASWRGIKPKVAAEHGAVACLTYSDPRDDGYAIDAVFPSGPMRPGDGVQRGSVMDMPMYPGDPLTPGVGATASATRLPFGGRTSEGSERVGGLRGGEAPRAGEIPTLTKIPVMPISYADAQPLLAAMTGPAAPDSFRGGLPISYRLGPGPAKVHFKISFNWDIKPLYNVIARISGSTFPDEWIVRGNHHDAWVNGAEDPASGMAPELEEARALGELRKQGWAPKRTIVYAAWDGEEPALLGSTEWVEAHRAELQQKAVAYINTDGNGRGFLNMSGSHSLEKFINDVARDISDPETGLTAWKRKQAQLVARGSAADREQARSRPELRIGALGSGSDYTPFLQHAGIASLNVGFGGHDSDGIYHSIYDDFYFYTRFLDGDFAYGRALAQTVGTAVMRLADADVLPFQFTNLADTVQTYVRDLQDLLKRRQDEIRERNRQIDDGVLAAVRDPRRPEVLPKKAGVPPALNFAPLENAVEQLAESAGRYQQVLSAGRARVAADRAALAALNAKLRRSEQQLIDEAGLPNRNWYRHLIYAPGFYTGYGVKTIPGVRENIEEGRYKEAEAEVGRAAQAISRLAALIDSASGELERMRQ